MFPRHDQSVRDWVFRRIRVDGGKRLNRPLANQVESLLYPKTTSAAKLDKPVGGVSKTTTTVQAIRKFLSPKSLSGPATITPVVSIRPFIDRLLAGAQAELQSFERSIALPKAYELEQNDLYRQTLKRGDQCMAAIRTILDQFGMERQPMQVQFHESMLQACLRSIYKYDFEQNIDRVLVENGWARMMQECLVVTARRMGKTTAVAMFAAALLMCCPNIIIIVFSVSLTSSRKMVQTIRDFLEMHPVGTQMLQRPGNKDKIVLIGGDHDRRVVESKPGRGEVILVCLFFDGFVFVFCFPFSCVRRIGTQMAKAKKR
jgi:hypothetical protein